MFWRKCSLQAFIKSLVYVFSLDDSHGLSEPMRNGNQRRTLLHQIHICGGSFYCLSLATKFHVYRLRIGEQVPFNILYGLTSTFFSK